MKHPNEFSEVFVGLMRDAVETSYYKYGPAKKNFAEGRVDALATLIRKLQAYKKTGNKELLPDIANYAMFEFMYPLHPHAHYDPQDDDRSTRPVGTPVNMEKNI